MQLTYRGISYNAAPSVETSEVEMTGQYRGSTTHIGLPVPVRSLQSGQKLTYRGVQY